MKKNSGNSLKKPSKVATAATRGSIPFSEIEISPLNPRNKSKSAVANMGDDIIDNGLIHPITLRKKQDGSGYEVIVGSRRFRAMLEKYGTDDKLEPDQYKIVDWTDEECIQSSLAENQLREDPSPVDMGQYLNWLAKQYPQKKDADLAKLTGIKREMVNDLRALADQLNLLPEVWQKALQESPNTRPDDSPAITITHYKHVRALVKGEKLDKQVVELLENAAKEHWSTAKLKREVDALRPGKTKAAAKREDPPAPDDDDPTGTESNEPAETDYEKVRKYLAQAKSACGPDTDLADEIGKLIDAVDKKNNDSDKDSDSAADTD